MKTTMKKVSLLAASLVLAMGMGLGSQASAQTMKHQAIKDCAVCHTPENAIGDNQFVVPSDKTCIACHGDYKALAAKTMPKDPHDPNPHASHHYGQNMSCTACHAEHKESRVLCNDCHNFPFKKLR